MQKHLARIGDILKKHGLHAMMWSDMYFHRAQPGSTASYPAGCTLSEAIGAAAPKDIDLVYWDYYTEEMCIRDRRRAIRSGSIACRRNTRRSCAPRTPS